MGSMPPDEPQPQPAAHTEAAETDLLPADEPAEDGPPQPSETAGKPRRRWLRRTVWTAVIVAGITLVLVCGSVLWVRITASGHQFSVRSAPSAPVALVLGAGLRPNGEPSSYLAARLDAGIQLYRDGKVQALLISGDNGSVNYDEVTAMRNYLVTHGMPSDRIVSDYAGFDTWDSCVRAVRIFGVKKALVITQQFHLPRAVFACRQAGIDADGVWAENRGGGAIAYYTFREQLANVKAAWDALTGANPKFLGPSENGLDVILGNK